MVGTANKDISHINYLKMKLCFGSHRSMLFLSKSQNSRSYWKTLLLCVIGIQFTSIEEKSLSLWNSEQEVKPSLWAG